MTPSRKISRRSFLGRVGGGTLMSGSFLALTGCVGYGYGYDGTYYGDDGYCGICALKQSRSDPIAHSAVAISRAGNAVR